jgi:hypothetical protein
MALLLVVVVEDVIDGVNVLNFLPLRLVLLSLAGTGDWGLPLVLLSSTRPPLFFTTLPADFLRESIPTTEGEESVPL